MQQALDRQQLRELRASLLGQRHDSTLHLLQGVSGVGKTTLVKALAQSMSAEGWKVFFLSAQAANHSFASLAQILDRLGAEMADDGTAFPSVQKPAEFRDRFRKTLAGLAKRSPVLIVLDGLDELSFDFWSESKLVAIAEVVRNLAGCHLILAARPVLQMGQLALAIQPHKVTLEGLQLDEFRGLARQLALPFDESQLTDLHARIHGSPKALKLMVHNPEAAFARLREHDSADIDKVYEVLYDLLLTQIFSSLDSTQKTVARVVLGFLTILKEPPRLVDLSGFIRAGIPRLAPDSPKALWRFLGETGIIQLLDLPSPADPSLLPSRPLRFGHQSLEDFLCEQWLGTESKVRLSRQVARVAQGLTSEIAGRYLLFHLVKGWGGDAEELTRRLCRVQWGKLLDSWNEQSGLLVDLGRAFEILHRDQQIQVSEVIEKALSDRLSRRGRSQEHDLYELACRMALALPPGPFVRQLSDDVIREASENEIVAVRQNELRTHLGRSATPAGSLRILVDLWPGYYPFFAVEEELNREGIFLDIVESSKEKIDMLLNEQADLIATTPGCLLGAKNSDIDRLRILCVLNQSDGADKILVDASRIDLDVNDWPVDRNQVAGAPKMAARHSTSRMFLNWFLAQLELDDQLLDVKEGDDYLKGLLRAVDSGTIAVLSTWEPYASMLIERNPDFKVACDTSRATRLVIDLLVADAARAARLATRRELRILADLYDRAVREGFADQDAVVEKLCGRLGTHKEIYRIGWKGVQCFQLSQMKRFFADGGRELEEIFERVAWAWGRSEQVDENREMTPEFRRHVKHLFDPPDLASAWLSMPRAVSPRVFISYAQDSSDDHKHDKWVKEFATTLRRKGIETILDQWELVPGDQLRSFMEKGIRENEFVLIICTEKYKERADRREGGVGAEMEMIAAELQNPANAGKFIPILRQGDLGSAVPLPLSDLFYLNLTEPDEQKYASLIELLYKIEPRPPQVGITPFASQ